MLLPLLFSAGAMLWATAAPVDTTLVPMSGDPVVQEFTPVPTIDPKYDWIELKSGEWLKGKIMYMYDDELVFDSDILDDLTIDWSDIKQIRSSRQMSLRLNNRTTVTGNIKMVDNEIHIVDSTEQVKSTQVVALVPNDGGELDKWNIKLSLGANIQSGNTEEISYNASATIVRRTADDRLNLSYLGQYTQTSGKLTASNQRGSVSYDYFLDDKIFIRPGFAQAYHDEFQNIAFQGLIGAGIGYQLYNDRDFEWDIVVAPAYQYTLFESVAPGLSNPEQTPAGIFITTLDYDITNDLEFEGTYQFVFTNHDSGLLTTHWVSTLSYDIDDIFEINLSFIWDRVQYPTRKADGTLPDQNDYTLVFGIGIDY